MKNSYRVLLILVFWYLTGLGAVYGADDVEIRSHQIFIVLDGSVEAAQSDPHHMDADATKMILSVLGQYNAASVLMAGKKAKTFSKLQYDFKEHLLHVLYQKIKRSNRNSKTTNFSEAIKSGIDITNGTKYSDDIRSSVILIMGQTEPLSPDEFMVDDLIENGIRLYVIRLVDTEMTDSWLNWKEAAISTNGMFVTNKEIAQLPRTLFEIYLGAVNPQLLEITGDTFQVDRVTTEVTIVANIKKDEELTFVSPENWRVTIKNGKTSNFQNKNLKIDTYGSMVMLSVKQPKPGLWALKGADQESMIAMTKSRQIAKLLLPRRRFCENEDLIISSYLARDGNIVRLQDKTEEIGFIAELLDSSKTQVSSSPLLDDGKFPDTIRGDGVFSCHIPLNGREGSQSLRVVTRMQMLSRKVLDHVQVDPGSWVDIIEPYEPVMEEKEAKLLIELARTLPYHSSTRISATYDGEKLEFKPDPAHRFRHITTLPAKNSSGLHELIITKQSSSSPLMIDKQTIKYNIKVIAEDNTKEIIIIFASLIIFLNLSVAGGIFARKWLKTHKLKFFRRKKVQEVKEEKTVKRKPPPPPDKKKLEKAKDTVEDRIENLEATFTPGEPAEIIDVVPKKGEKPAQTETTTKTEAAAESGAPAKGDTPVKDDTPVKEGETGKGETEPAHAREMEPERMDMMDSVSDRIGDIVAAHIKDQVKGDVDQSGLSMDDLDHDGDPEYASSATLDAMDKMLDFGFDSGAPEETAEEKSDSDDRFGNFSQDEMNELFGSFGGKFDEDQDTSTVDTGTVESETVEKQDKALDNESADETYEDEQSAEADNENSKVIEGEVTQDSQAEKIAGEQEMSQSEQSKPKATIHKNPSTSIPTDAMLEEIFKQQEALLDEEVEEKS